MKIRNLLKSSLLIITLAILASCKQEVKVPADSFTVTGNIKGLDTEFMSRSVYDSNGKRTTDSIFVKDGTFTYTAKISKATHVIFWPNVERTIKRSGRGYYPAKSSQFAFLAKPGDHIVFKGEVTDFINAYPSGTKANNDLSIINSKIFPLLNTSVNYLLKKNKLDKEDSRVKIITDSITQLDAKIVKLKKEFILTNSTSEAAVWYLSDMMLRRQLSNEEAVAAFKAFDTNLSENSHYQEIATRIKGIESTMIGKIVPDFTSNKTLDDTDFTFSSLKGKYVLIDFWGIWCGPCVAEMPKVKEYSKKYADKLTILGINSGDSKEKIKDFISKNGYDWKQVLSGKDSDNLVLKFNVSGFPTKFIVDPEGKILHRYLGNSEDAFIALDKLLE